MRARWILLAAALVAFGASLGSGFHFDDYAIFSDPALQSGRGWLEVWAPMQTRPLTHFTFWMNRVLGEGDPLGYHLFNLVFHLGAVLLAWECLRRLLPERVALLAGVVFALHPLQAEAVNYVWARSIVLAAACCFAALWMWLEGRPWIALTCFALGLLAKEECAAFPLFIVWLTWSGGLPEARRSKVALAGMFALALAAGARVIWATSVIPGALAGVQAGISPIKYLVAQGVAVCRYIQLFLVPYGFTVDPEIPVTPWVGVACWALLAAVTVYLLRTRRTFAAWWIGGLILLLPSSSIFPAADLAADRRMYLPMFAFAVLAAMVLTHLEARLRTPHLMPLIALVLLALSVSRTVVWMSEQRLWSEAVERAPGKLRPKLQLSRALPAAKGLELLSKARLQAPYEPAIATEIGKILMSEGQADGALEEFGRALALSPTDARNMNNRGVALQALGQTEAARADFQRALRTDPSLAEAKENLAKLPPAPQ
jgi:tetratricopeptide (TPR) repeat protein